VLPRITIVTPSFNQASFMRDTIESILGQKYPNLEYYVVDGGSKDGSVEIVRKYNDRINWWISEVDRGQSHAINKGIERATGDFFSWLNSDDVLLPSALMSIAEFIQRNPKVDIVVGGLLLGSEDGTIKSCYIPTRSVSWCMRRGFYDLFQPSTFIRRSMLNRIGYLREDLHCRLDVDLFERLIGAGAQWGYIRQPLSMLRRHPAAKGESLGERYAQDRVMLVSQHEYPEWQRDLALNIRRFQRLLNGSYFINWFATNKWQRRNIASVWGWEANV